MRARRSPHRLRILKSAFVITSGLAGVWTGAGTAGEHGRRETPYNATQPPGSHFEGYPSVGRAQSLRILREILGGTAAQTVRRPAYSGSRLVHRVSERLAVRCAEVIPPALARVHFDCGECCARATCALDLAGSVGTPPMPAKLTLLPGSEPSIQALLALIGEADQRIDLMMYGWDDDPTGREVADALARRARAGVRVRVMVDRTGFLIHNAAAARGDATFLDRLRGTPNVTVLEPSGAYFRFDHRKLAIIDERVAWSGGMILTEVARRRWHNFAYLAEGPVVEQLAGAFAEAWQEQGGTAEGPCPRPPVSPEPVPNATVRVIKTDIDDRSLKNAIYHAVDHAQRSIRLENPYFSDQILIKKLVAARRRGVDVRVILTLRGNIHALNQFERLTANRLLRGGVRVWLFPEMTHVKAMSADGTWAYLGTGNFDELSLRNNREIGISVQSPEVVRALDAVLFQQDLLRSQELRGPLPPPKHRVVLEALSLWY